MSELFRKEAVETQRERLWGEVILVQPFSFYLVTMAVCMVVLVISLFLIFGTYAHRASVTGYLEPDQGLVKVYASQSGIVSKAYFKDGDLVERGATLFTVSTRRNTDQSGDVDSIILTELEQSKHNIEEQLTQQQRLDELEEKDLKQRITGLKNERDQQQREIKVRQHQYTMTLERLRSVEGLLNKQYISQIQYRDMQEHSLTAQVQVEEAKRLLLNLDNQLNELGNQLAQLPARTAINLSNRRQSLADLNQKLEEIKGRRSYTIRAPLSGRITTVQIREGQAAKENTPLLAIIPQDAVLQAQLFVPTRAIGFVRSGQEVRLQYAAFPYQRFGLHEGEIVQVTETILAPNELPIPLPLDEPVYRVTVMPKKQVVSAFGKEFPLQAGMLLQADIILGERSLGEWLLDPIYSLTGRI